MLVKTLKQKNMGCAYLYFYVHFIVEIACFFYLSKNYNSNIVWLIPLLYDGIAFMPQSIIGYINDKYPKINIGIIGTIFIILGLLLDTTKLPYLIPLLCICIGNAFIHVNGAEVTIKNSNGKLSHSGIFVAGGSFGVITGKLLSKYMFPTWIIILISLTMIPAILLGDVYPNTKKRITCNKYNYSKSTINPKVIILLAVLVVIVRGYMGYGIPTSWNKTMFQTIVLYVIMGFGKALGGILADSYGIKKIATISTLLCIPFLILGDNLMLVSLIGVMFFSMTMSITLGILVSVLKKNPGLAFGLTTIGLFLGTVPIFFIKITNNYLNASIIILFSIICAIVLNIILEEKHD